MKKNAKVTEIKSFMMLPPAPDKCQVCAVKHPPEQPHDASSIFYQMKYKMDTGKEPSWKTAMKHCSPEMKKLWTSELEKKGVDVKGGRILPEVKK